MVISTINKVIGLIVCAVALAACGSSDSNPSPSNLETSRAQAQVQPSEVGADPATASKIEWGYVPLPDGNELRYTAWLPEGEGPFPVLMMYDGYFGGSDPSRAADIFVYDMLAKGYAIVGVSLRGSACSSDSWELFNLQQAQDGAFAVDWLAQKPWSNGKVGLYGYSYAGIMQLWVASMKPKHLVAVGPGMPIGDTYRDIGFPGGIFNSNFPPVWGASLNADWAIAYRNAVEISDTKCIQHGALHAAQNNLNSLAIQIPQHPTVDSWHDAHSAMHWTKNIDVPLFGVLAWQDEQTGSRSAYYYNELDPEKTWLIASNGHHTIHQYSSSVQAQYQSFYDYFLKGIDNGFDKTPRVQVWHEMKAADLAPNSVTAFERLPVKVEPQSFFLSKGGLMGDSQGSKDSNAGTSYLYPLPAPNVIDSTAVLDRTQTNGATANIWTVSRDIAAGRAVFTTLPLSKAVTTYGPSSVDLWMSSTSTDFDVQVTIVEVRPDGQEQYIQRGWLRASHRALDESKSTSIQPHHPHTSESLLPMKTGVAELLRVEMMPFSHVFREGSSIRIYIENPSLVGMWGFQSIMVPQNLTVHHGADFPSKLVLGTLPKANIKPELPACGTVDSQPCRSNPVPQPKQ